MIKITVTCNRCGAEVALKNFPGMTAQHMAVRLGWVFEKSAGEPSAVCPACLSKEREDKANED